MEVGMYAQLPTIEEEKWQSQAVPRQVYQLVLSELQYIAQIYLIKLNISGRVTTNKYQTSRQNKYMNTDSHLYL